MRYCRPLIMWRWPGTRQAHSPFWNQVHRAKGTDVCGLERVWKSEYFSFLFFSFLFSFLFSFFLFLHTYLPTYLLLERQCEWGRGKERERHRIWSRLQALNWQHRARHRAQAHGLWHHDVSRSWRLTWRSHPGALWIRCLNCCHSHYCSAFRAGLFGIWSVSGCCLQGAYTCPSTCL